MMSNSESGKKRFWFLILISAALTIGVLIGTLYLPTHLPPAVLLVDVRGFDSREREVIIPKLTQSLCERWDVKVVIYVGEYFPKPEGGSRAIIHFPYLGIDLGLMAAQASFERLEFAKKERILLFIPSIFPSEAEWETLKKLKFSGIKVVLVELTGDETIV